MKQSNVQWRHMALSHCSAPGPSLPSSPAAHVVVCLTLDFGLRAAAVGVGVGVGVGVRPPPSESR